MFFQALLSICKPHVAAAKQRGILYSTMSGGYNFVLNDDWLYLTTDSAPIGHKVESLAASNQKTKQNNFYVVG
jgi:hypothetical protein